MNTHFELINFHVIIMVKINFEKPVECRREQEQRNVVIFHFFPVQALNFPQNVALMSA